MILKDYQHVFVFVQKHIAHNNCSTQLIDEIQLIKVTKF